MHLILFGPYGCGKGTQARILSEKYDLAIFSTGDELRRHIKEETALGKKVAPIVASGKLISDEDIREMVSEFLDKHLGGFIFDGLPRTFQQAKDIDKLLEKKNIQVQRFLIDIPESLSLARQIGRKTCPKCRAIFPASYESNVCGECKTSFEDRAENDRKVAEKRIEVFNTEVRPVIEDYKEKGLMKVLDGTLPIEEVTKKIEQHLH